MKRILIADGNSVVRATLRQLFEQDGWNVCGEAADGEEVIAKGQELRPDLVVLELRMRFINGLAAARALKEAMPSIRLILFTSFGSLVTSEELARAGLSESIPKSEAGRLITAARRLVSSEQHT